MLLEHEPLYNFLSTCARLGFPKRKLLLHLISFGVAKILLDTVNGLFPQHQCCKHTIWENTDQCCPYGNSTPGHSAMKMSLFQSNLPLWLLAYLRKFLRNTHFLAFCLSIYCLKTLFQVIRNDWQNFFWQCNFEVCTKFQTRKNVL